MTEAAVRAAFERQAEACRRLGSPFTADLINLLGVRLTATAGSIECRVLAWPGEPVADALALRLAGALHGLVLAGADDGLAALYPPAAPAPDDATLWRAIGAALEAHEPTIHAWLDHPPQTNEVGRSAMLLPLIGTAVAQVGEAVGGRVALYEIGASAGLNLRLDRFRYAYSADDVGWEWGAAGAGVALAPALRGALPPPAPSFEVIDRVGCDRAPIDIADPQAALRLRSFLWPDQPARLARLDAAIAAARETPARLDAADAADWVDREIPNRPDGALGVLMHSIMWLYLPPETQARIEARMAAEGAIATPDRPLAWARMEGHPEGGGDALFLTIWDGGDAPTATRILARTHPHGAWLDWRRST